MANLVASLTIKTYSLSVHLGSASDHSCVGFVGQMYIPFIFVGVYSGCILGGVIVCDMDFSSTTAKVSSGAKLQTARLPKKAARATQIPGGLVSEFLLILDDDRFPFERNAKRK